MKINSITRGCANHFKHAVAKHSLAALRQFIWWRVVNMVRRRHRWKWLQVWRWLTSPRGWKPISWGGITLYDVYRTPDTRYRWRGNYIPTLWSIALTEPTA
ncbi:group II intron maturase-specific domain-containing protein [Streptomyces sp. FIT100]|uniref:group II intron maturase-specific domain-containing protein n=1 Tax=Streptomyces sp. FIT100 TaxID=2837956 RepID=UPI0021C64FFD|nr:group II intron maturase-specific domain-containing protein [Streptomyces sp. FIT100]